MKAIRQSLTFLIVVLACAWLLIAPPSQAYDSSSSPSSPDLSASNDTFLSFIKDKDKDKDKDEDAQFSPLVSHTDLLTTSYDMGLADARIQSGFVSDNNMPATDRNITSIPPAAQNTLAPTLDGMGLLYVLNDKNGAENEIYGYAVNESTGTLTLLDGFPMATGGHGAGYGHSQMLTIDVANQRLYAINDGSDTISAYEINSATGGLTALPFSPIALESGRWNSVAVHPTGSPLIVGDAGAQKILDGRLVSLHITSTSATSAAGTPYTLDKAEPFSTAFSQDGSYLYTGGNYGNSFASFSINSSNGELTALTGSPFESGAGNPVAYATDNEGRLFLTNPIDQQIQVFTTKDGIPSGVAGNPFASGLIVGAHGVLHPAGFYMLADRQGNQVGVYQISGSGESTTLAAVSGSPFPSDSSFTNVLRLNATGNFLYAANAVRRNLTTFSVNRNTGELTQENLQPLNSLGSSGLLVGMSYLAPIDPTADRYEFDDICKQAGSIPTDGTLQHHTFHQQGDTDWVSFQAAAGTTYVIEAQVPPESVADISMVLYDQCNGSAQGGENPHFSPTIRLEFTALNDGALFLELYNQPPKVFGSDVSYNLSVRALNQSASPGALILLAGRLRSNDEVQDNIHFVTNRVYDLFLDQEYTEDRIYYLATDPSLTGFDASATAANLQSAITTWALDKVGPDRALTLYLMDHGDRNRLYLDRPRNEWVTTEQLDSWLSELEAARPEAKVNVIIEACYAGSFMATPQTMSRPGRVVITSTGADKLAWASEEGAIFSDHFIAALARKTSLWGSFQAANWAVESTRRNQTPWLDANGNSIPNEIEDEAIAARRGFAYAGTLSSPQWPPYIADVPVPVVEDERAEIRAEVRDDFDVARVWAIIYPPSYQPPDESEELVQESLQTTLLLDQGNDIYAATYPGFNENGSYRIVIYAEDQDGQQARPVTVEVEVGTVDTYALYLPLLMR